MEPGRRLREVAFTAVLAVIVVPPSLRHFFGVRSMHDWGMMGNAGLPLREARYFAVEGGRWRPLEYGHLLPSRQETRPMAAGLRSDEEVLRLGRRLCAELGARADVRVITRVGRRQGWASERRGEGNLCAE